MNRLNSFLLTSIFIMIGQTAFSQSPIFTNKDKVALGGYDVVAYHQLYDAVRGSQTHSTSLNGITYYFSKEANKKAFQENPAKFLPEYGGFCAFAMAMQGATVPADPTTFKIRDGKLYFFYNDFYEGSPFNTIIPWNGKEKEMINKANTNWAAL